MSHSKERTEKNCLNCGAEVQGRFCHICGQQNIVPHETFWGLITHFVYDITHFDGKFFSTLKYLLFRPGFLSKEYQRGRRAGYLHPIKMYVFTSAVFFFVFFSVRSEEDMMKGFKIDLPQQRAAMQQQILTSKDAAKVKLLQDSLRLSDTMVVQLEALKLIEKDPSLSDSVREAITPIVNNKLSKENFAAWPGLPATEAAYDSMQQALPSSQRDGWVKHFVGKKILQLNEKYKYDKGNIAKLVFNKFMHSLPKMMFISLPFMAVFISLLYIRQKKSNYVDHGILVVHGYIAMYILILLFMLAGWAFQQSHWLLAKWATIGLAFYMVYYNYKSLRNFFEQSRTKTLVKFSVLFVLTFILFAILSVAFVINSLLQV